MKSLSLQKPHLLIVVGIPGSGKTFFASQFAKMFNAPFIHYEAIKNSFEGSLSEDLTADVAGLLFAELIKTGETIILEGPGASRTERAALAHQARSVGYVPLFIWVQTEPVTAKARAVTGIRGSTNATISLEDFEHELKHFTPLASTEKSVVISGKHTFASQAKIILKRLVEPEVAVRKIPVKLTAPRPTRNGRTFIQ